MATLVARPFPPGYRGAGVLLHVTSLPSRHGIGDLGPSAFTWIDRLREAGQQWWQGLPVGPTGWGDSPYQSLSSFAGNGLQERLARRRSRWPGPRAASTWRSPPGWSPGSVSKGFGASAASPATPRAPGPRSSEARRWARMRPPTWDGAAVAVA